MRSIVATVALVCLVVPAVAADTSDQDFMKWLQSPANGYGAAIDAHDAAKLMLFYTDDAIRVAPWGIVSGRTEIEKGFAAEMKKNNPRDFKVTFDHVHVLPGDNAWAAGSWSLTISPGKQEQHVKGFWSDVYEHDGDVWKIRVESFNMTPPPPKSQ
jgi:ketosteroid isomerase-like protein